MRRFLKKQSVTAGLPPGSLVHIGEKRTTTPKLTLFQYDEESLHEEELKDISDLDLTKKKKMTRWINMDGVHDTAKVEELGNQIKLHPLTLEDIVNTDQRPKIEDYDKYLFIIIKMIYVDEHQQEITAEQISLVLFDSMVISFQEGEGDVFNTVRDRLRKGKGKIRKSGADYLLYALLDAIVDHYYVVLERVGTNLESLEDVVVHSPTPEILKEIYYLKQDLVVLRKSVWPLREVISGLQRLETPLIKDTTDIYLRDVYDHTIQTVDTIETYRDVTSGMMDIYLSSVSNKMNEVMKVLTIFASIFIPLTFIAGVYGMNFHLMPELEWTYGYPIILLIMGLVGGTMLLYFHRKGWL